MNKIDEELEKRFINTSKFSNNNINKFILLLRKAVYPHDYMKEQEKSNETSLSEKEEFYSNLNIEYITDADYMQAKRACKVFEVKSWINIMTYILKLMHYIELMFLKIFLCKNLLFRSCKNLFQLLD